MPLRRDFRRSPHSIGKGDEGRRSVRHGGGLYGHDRVEAVGPAVRPRRDSAGGDRLCAGARAREPCNVQKAPVRLSRPAQGLTTGLRSGYDIGNSNDGGSSDERRQFWLSEYRSRLRRRPFLPRGRDDPHKSYTQNAGGKGLNQSIAVSRSGQKVHHAGLLGPEGARLAELLSGSGVDLRYLKHTDVPQGHAVIQVQPDGQNCISSTAAPIRRSRRRRSTRCSCS